MASVSPTSAGAFVIFQVQIDLTRTQVTIIDQGFTTGEKVSLGLTDITKQCSLGSPPGTVINCALTSPITPGAYRLLVSGPRGFGATSDIFDVTTPLVGPRAGPKGATGATGPVGAVGPHRPDWSLLGHKG